MLLPAHLSMGELDSAEVRVLALLVGALLSVIAKAQCFIAMLGGKVLQCSRQLGVIWGLGDGWDDPFAFSFVPLFSQTFVPLPCTVIARALGWSNACRSDLTFVSSRSASSKVQPAVQSSAQILRSA